MKVAGWGLIALGLYLIVLGFSTTAITWAPAAFGGHGPTVGLLVGMAVAITGILIISVSRKRS